MPTLQINDQTLDVPEGTLLLTAARQLGIDVPTLCAREGLDHVTSCMVCLVEDLGTGHLHPACATPATDGMRIATDSAAVGEARRTALELLLSDHVGDCEGPCRRGCPAGMAIPVMLRHIAAGNPDAAIRVVRRHIALPAVLGRICPAPCESVCRRAALDTPVAICRLKRWVADTDRLAAESYRPELSEATGLRVAVIGGGPAGLAAACQVMMDGHAGTLFEQRERPGGGLRTPDLNAKLPAAVLDAEIDQILELGVTLESGRTLGKDLSLTELKSRFDAVILACGAIGSGPDAAFGLERGPRGVAVDRATGRTSDPLVFACGNVVAPGRLAVRALAQGRAAAVAVNQMLRGEPVVGPCRRYDHRLTGKLTPEDLAVWVADAGSAGVNVGDECRADDTGAAEARREAARCLHCDCRKPDACRLRRYADRYGANPRTWKAAERRPIEIVRQGGVIYEPGKCIACGICVRIAAAAREPLGLTFIGRGFNVRVGVPFNESLKNGLSKVATECIANCPTGALAATCP